VIFEECGGAKGGVTKIYLAAAGGDETKKDLRRDNEIKK
jgi:hypothetical protein